MCLKTLFLCVAVKRCITQLSLHQRTSITNFAVCIFSRFMLVSCCILCVDTMSVQAGLRNYSILTAEWRHRAWPLGTYGHGVKLASQGDCRMGLLFTGIYCAMTSKFVTPCDSTEMQAASDLGLENPIQQIHGNENLNKSVLYTEASRFSTNKTDKFVSHFVTYNGFAYKQI